MNGRRKFLLQMGAIGGAIALPSNVSYALSKKELGAEGKEGAIKVKVVFIYRLDDVQAVPDWPNIGYDFRPDMKDIIRQLNAGVPDVEFIPDKAVNEKDGEDLVKRDEAEGNGIAGYIAVFLNPWYKALYGLVKSGKPVLSVPLPYAGDGGWLTYNSDLAGSPNYSALASLDFADVVKAAGAFSVLRNGNAADFKKEADKLIEQIIPKECSITPKVDKPDCLSPEEVLVQCKGIKVLSLEGMSTDTINRLKEDFGLEFINVPYSEINAATSAANAAKAAKIAKKWKENAVEVYDVSDDELLGSAKVYLGMKDLLKKYDAKAITINCLGACYGGYIKHYPCLGFMELQNEGLLGVCENDCSGIVSMMMGNIITKGKRIGYMSDPVLDYSHRSIIYAHCVCTTKFFGKDGPSSRYEILTHSEDRNGASVRTIAPIGYPVTTFQFRPWNRDLVIHTGVISGNSKDDRACRTKIIAEIPGDYSKMTLGWTNWHMTTFIGDIKNEVVALAEKIGYKVICQS